MDEQEKQQWAEYARSRSIEDRNRLVERYYWLANMLAKKFYLRVAGTGPMMRASRIVTSAGLLRGTYIFVNRESGLCLDVEGQSETPLVQLQQLTCSSSVAQSFTLTTVTP